MIFPNGGFFQIFSQLKIQRKKGTRKIGWGGAENNY